MPPLVPGQGEETSFGGSSAAPTAPIGSAGAGGSGGATPASGTAGAASDGAGPVPPGAPNCPTYVDDFVPRINTPVCSKCHGAQAKLPNWGVYSSAKASCTAIGSRVASGSMPPRSSGLTLTAEQRALVADWVRLGCPQAESNLPASCFPPPAQGAGGSANPPQGSGGTNTVPPQGTGGASTPGSGGAATNPPIGATLSITRAEWDAENQSLRLEGRCSDYSATLRADFGGRMEPLANDTGRFRNVFNNVATDPMTITVTASNGVTATSAVDVK
jgi:hypothetical protein